MKLKLDDWLKDVLATKGNIALRSGRQVGKSTVVSIKAVEYAISHPNKLVMIVAAVERQAQLLFEKVLNYAVDNYKNKIRQGKFKPTKSRLYLKNGSRIYSLPTGLTGYGIRGYTVDLLIVDEAAFVPDAVYDAIMPMMSITKGAVWLLSTPFGRQGYFYNSFQDKSYKHFRISSEDCPRKDQAFLDRQKERMSKVSYAQEYLGEFIDELRQFFPTELIEKCMIIDKENVVRPKHKRYLGVDVARLGEDETVLCSIEKDLSKTLRMFDLEITTKTRLPDTCRLIKFLDYKYDYTKIYIDTGGVGAGVFDTLLEDDQTKRKVISIDNAQKSLDYEESRRKKLFKEDLYTNLLELMQRGSIQLFKSPELFQSLKSVQYEYTDGGKIKIFGKYTHIAEALVRAAWCMKDKTLNIWCR